MLGRQNPFKSIKITVEPFPPQPNLLPREKELSAAATTAENVDRRISPFDPFDPSTLRPFDRLRAGRLRAGRLRMAVEPGSSQ